MEATALASLGKIAGLAGIAVGVVLFIVKKVLDKSGGLAKPEQAALLNRIVLGAFLLGGAGIFSWVLTENKGQTVTGAPCGMTVGGSVSGGSINCGDVTTTTSGGK
jgi:hypothetical protein